MKAHIRYLLVILFAALALSVFAFMLALPEGIYSNTFFCGDAQSYLDAGKQLWLKGELSAFRTWGYAVITGIPYVLGASDRVAMGILVCLNFFLYLSSSILVFILILKFGKPSWALAGALIYLVSPGLLFINLSVMTEPLFVFVILLALWCLKEFLDNKSRIMLVWFVVLMLYSAAVRPVNLYLSLAVAIVAVLYFLQKRGGIRFAIPVLLSVVVLVVMPMVYMKKQYGVLTYTHNSKYVLYHYTAAYSASLPGSTQARMYDSFNRLESALDKAHGWKKKGDDINWVARDSLYGAVFNAQLKQRPRSLAVAVLQNLKENSSTGSAFIPYTKNGGLPTVIETVSRVQNILFSILGIVLSLLTGIIVLLQVIRKRWELHHFMPVFLVVQMAVLAGLGALSFWQGDRFSLGIFPLILVLLSWILRTENVTE